MLKQKYKILNKKESCTFNFHSRREPQFPHLILDFEKYSGTEWALWSNQYNYELLLFVSLEPFIHPFCVFQHIYVQFRELWEKNSLLFSTCV